MNLIGQTYRYYIKFDFGKKSFIYIYIYIYVLFMIYALVGTSMSSVLCTDVAFIYIYIEREDLH